MNRLLVVAIVWSTLAGASLGAAVRYDFIGTVYKIRDSNKVFADLRMGDRVTGFVSYDTAWQPERGDGIHAGIYWNPPVPFVGVGLKFEPKLGTAIEFTTFPDDAPYGWANNDVFDPETDEGPY